MNRKPSRPITPVPIDGHASRAEMVDRRGIRRRAGGSARALPRPTRAPTCSGSRRGGTSWPCRASPPARCVAAVAALVTAARSGQPNIIWLGIGCVAVGLGMLGHGLTTPGVFGRARTTSGSAGSRTSRCACSRCACSPPAGRRRGGPNRFIARHPLPAIVVPTLTIAALVDDRVRPADGAQRRDRRTRGRRTRSTCVADRHRRAAGFVVRTHWRRWHLGYDVFQFAIVLAATASIAAIVAFEHGKFQQSRGGTTTATCWPASAARCTRCSAGAATSAR